MNLSVAEIYLLETTLGFLSLAVSLCLPFSLLLSFVFASCCASRPAGSVWLGQVDGH